VALARDRFDGPSRTCPVRNQPSDGVFFGPTRARPSYERGRQLRRPYQHHHVTVFGKDFRVCAFWSCASRPGTPKTVSASPLRRGRFLSPPSHDDACTKKPRTMPGLQRCWREDQYLAATGAPNGLNFTDTLARMRSSSPPMLRPLIPSRAKASAEDAWYMLVLRRRSRQRSHPSRRRSQNQRLHKRRHASDGSRSQTAHRWWW
jgi:hypothetical protein